MVIIWAAIGYQVIVILAGLQNISVTYYEAARIDGAGGVKQFFYITLPLLTPTLYFVLTLAVISMFKEFEIVYMLIPSTQYNTSSPAIDSSRTVVRYFYDLTFRGEFNEGYGFPDHLGSYFDPEQIAEKVGILCLNWEEESLT